jgi:taurine--2-oxoglutarate transaminase
VFFMLGGADANEVKFARQAGQAARPHHRADRSYHGASYATMALATVARGTRSIPMVRRLHAPPPYAYRCPYGSSTAEECGNRRSARWRADR